MTVGNGSPVAVAVRPIEKRRLPHSPEFISQLQKVLDGFREFSLKITDSTQLINNFQQAGQKKARLADIYLDRALSYWSLSEASRVPNFYSQDLKHSLAMLDSATKDLEEARAIDPKNENIPVCEFMIHMARAETLLAIIRSVSAGKDKQAHKENSLAAFTAAQKAIKIMPENEDALMLTAKICFESEAYSSTIDFCNKLLTINPANKDAEALRKKAQEAHDWSHTI